MTTTCFVCKRECPCLCFEIDTDFGTIHFCSPVCYSKSNEECDWDAEFGNYDGHNEECIYGGHFKEKWQEVIKNLKVWREMALEKHRILHKLGYFKTSDSASQSFEESLMLADKREPKALQIGKDT